LVDQVSNSVLDDNDKPRNLSTTFFQEIAHLAETGGATQHQGAWCDLIISQEWTDFYPINAHLLMHFTSNSTWTTSAQKIENRGHTTKLKTTTLGSTQFTVPEL
jgi:hypothetical protein